MRKIVYVSLFLLLTPLVCFAADITVGLPAINRGDAWNSGGTVITLDNPATESGLIDSINVWASQNMTGIEFGAFSISGSVLTCGGNTDGSNLSATAGGVTTFTAPADFTAFEINIGEYIGIFYSGGKLERDFGCCGGIMFIFADIIPGSVEAFTDADDGISLNAEGTLSGGAAPITQPIIWSISN